MSLNKILDRDVRAIKNDLQQMIEETKIQYAETYQAIKNNDESLANMVIEHDRIINGMQNEFTSMALWKIAKQQMVAGDLRLAVGSILIAREIEIVADYSKHISEFFATNKPDEKKMGYITEMFEIVVKMLDIIANIFDDDAINQNENILKLEEDLNKEFFIFEAKMILKIRSAASDEEAFEFGRTAKQLKTLERAGDHLVNIFEIISFIKYGKFDDFEKRMQLDDGDFNATIEALKF